MACVDDDSITDSYDFQVSYTPAPTAVPSTAVPSAVPSGAPTNYPTFLPSPAPTSAPTTAAPTSAPTTAAPTSAPTTAAPTPTPSTGMPTVPADGAADARDCLYRNGTCDECCGACDDVSDYYYQSPDNLDFSNYYPSTCVCLVVDRDDDVNDVDRSTLHISLTEHDDCLAVFGHNTEVYGGEGSDSIVMNGGHNTIHGGSGNDFIYDQGWDSVINGEDGDDTIQVQSLNGEDTGYLTTYVYGYAGADDIDTTGDNVRIKGGDGADDIYVHSGVSVDVYGEAGDDRIVVGEVDGASGSTEFVTVDGGTGDDDVVYN